MINLSRIDYYGPMATAVVTAILDTAVDEVWARVRDFSRWDEWIERITKIEMDPGQESAPVGAVRTVYVADDTGGHTIRERLVSHDDRLRTLSYDFPAGSPFPVRGYLGTVHVEAITVSPGATGSPGTAGPSRTYLRWTGSYDTDSIDEAKVMGAFCAIYEAFIRDLASTLAAGRSC
jgi:Polyketide cyclase / dehydrase and lipid transport